MTEKMKTIQARVTGDRWRRVCRALEILGVERTASPDDSLPGQKDAAFSFPVPVSIYDAAVKAAAGSTDIAELTLAAVAVQIVLDDAERVRAGLPLNLPKN